jgi:hypothetical protein
MRSQAKCCKRSERAAMTLSPIILTAQMGKVDQAWATMLRAANYPPEQNQVPAHISLFRHLPPAYLPEIKSRIAAMAAQYPPPDAWISSVMFLGRGNAFAVESPELMALWAELADGLTGLLTPQDQAQPRLHITIQNKVSAKKARELNNRLHADFKPRSLSITGISAYYYRGGPWENIATWSFRG